jgi:diguanylate cyclase (GGDEF)-like protein
VLTENTKASDLPARYGGDEFVLLLPDCTADQCFEVAERLRNAVTAEATTVRVTVSAGTASIPDNAADGERLVAAADAALYEAKRAGRNRSVRSTRHPFRVESADPRIAGV